MARRTQPKRDLLALFTATPRLSGRERTAAAAAERKHQREVLWRTRFLAEKAFHEAAALGIASIMANHVRRDDAARQRHRAACEALVRAVDTYVNSPAPCREDARAKAINLRRWHGACNGLHFDAYADSRPRWIEAASADEARFALAREGR